MAHSAQSAKTSSIAGVSVLPRTYSLKRAEEKFDRPLGLWNVWIVFPDSGQDSISFENQTPVDQRWNALQKVWGPAFRKFRFIPLIRHFPASVRGEPL